MLTSVLKLSLSVLMIMMIIRVRIIIIMKMMITTIIIILLMIITISALQNKKYVIINIFNNTKQHFQMEFYLNFSVN